jgi:putative transposase
MISTGLIGRKLAPSEVSNANKELIDAVEKWRTRDLSEEPIKYLFLDGVTFDMRIDREHRESSGAGGSLELRKQAKNWF